MTISDRIADRVQTQAEAAARKDVKFHRVETYEEARTRAADRMMTSNARFLPCMIYRQGQRTMITFAMPYSMLRQHIRIDSTPKAGDARVHLNRVLMADHVATIKNYLEQNSSQYILPGLTLNAAADVEIFQVGDPIGGVTFGFIVFGSTTIFVPVDGQHRTAAIVGYEANGRRVDGVLDEVEGFGLDGVSVQLTLEDNVHQLHQDFADAARTKPISANTLAAYDMREPVNQLVNAIVEKSALLKGRVDTTSKTLSARSQAVFLLSSIRGLLKVFMLGSSRWSELQFEKEVRDRFAQPGAREKTYEAVMRLLNTLTENMKPWDTIALLMPGQQEANVIPDLRQEYVNLTMSGLVVLGTVGHRVTTAGLSDTEQVAAYERVAALDWRRDNSLWRTTGFVKVAVSDDGEYQLTETGVPKLDVTRSRTDIEATVARVMEICGIR